MTCASRQRCDPARQAIHVYRRGMLTIGSIPQLTVVIVSPAFNPACCRDRASVVGPSRDRAGAAPAEVERDRDQIVRSCQEKAKMGTIVCFIASPTYEQARRCP